MPGRRLRAERPRFALLGPRREPEELLLDDVGDLADAALEDVGLLEHRRLDLAVAVARGEVGGEALEARPGGRSRAAAGRGCRAGRGRWAWRPKCTGATAGRERPRARGPVVRSSAGVDSRATARRSPTIASTASWPSASTTSRQQAVGEPRQAAGRHAGRLHLLVRRPRTPRARVLEGDSSASRSRRAPHVLRRPHWSSTPSHHMPRRSDDLSVPASRGRRGGRRPRPARVSRGRAGR